MKNLCLPTFVKINKSPGSAPSRPPWPFFGMRTRDPVSTPAGIFTFTCSVFGVTPLPLQSEHGCRRRPVPSQSGQPWENCKRPPVRKTWPVPLHVVHVTTAPPVSPAPMHREHCSERLTVILVVRPVTASSKLNASGISISRPRFGIARGGSGSARTPPLPPLPPNRSENMSRKLELPPAPGEALPWLKSNPEKSKPGAPAPPPRDAPAPYGESALRLSL